LQGNKLSKKQEFEEIAHTGGKVKFNVKIDAEGRFSYNVGWTHSRPTPAALFAVYAIPQGVAVGDINLGGEWGEWGHPLKKGVKSTLDPWGQTIRAECRNDPIRMILVTPRFTKTP